MLAGLVRRLQGCPGAARHNADGLQAACAGALGRCCEMDDDDDTQARSCNAPRRLICESEI